METACNLCSSLKVFKAIMLGILYETHCGSIFIMCIFYDVRELTCIV